MANAMGEFTVWNWATYGVLVIAAFGVAIEGAIRRFPNLNEKVTRHWLGLALSFGPLALVTVATLMFLVRPNEDSLPPSQISTASPNGSTESQRLEAALKRERNDREQIVVGFLGGPTWQHLSKLIGELGLEVEDVDPRSYPRLRFEKTFRRGLGVVYVYSRTQEPESVVNVETRIDVDDVCWYYLNPALGEREQRVSRAIRPMLTEMERSVIGALDTRISIRRTITITEGATAQYLAQELDRLAEADNAARNANSEMCPDDRAPLEMAIAELIKRWPTEAQN